MAGETYVVFGKAGGFAASLDLSTLNGTNGFRLDGIDVSDRSGVSVASAGDVNGDGFDDVIVGAFVGDPGGDSSAGETYVVFGKASGFAASLDLSTLDGTNGFRLDGVDAADFSGVSVASAGDFNGDGFDDVIVGAFGGDPGGDSFAGETYVVFGKASGFAVSLDLSTLNGTNGFRLDGIDVSDRSGVSVASAGDVNGDGFADLIIGADSGDPGGDSYAGESYVVFGGKPGEAVSRTGTAIANRINGGDFADTLSGLGGADTLIGLAGDDTLHGGDANDQLFAGLGNDVIDGGLGDDFARTSNGNDSVFGGDGDDTLGAGSGKDFLRGNAGADLLLASNGDDRLFGDGDDDTLLGGGGRDLLTGGAGDDRLVGGTESDRFNFAPGSGADIIVDFAAGAASGDVIGLFGYGAALNSFAEVIAASTQVGGAVVIDLGGGDTITLQSVTLASLTAGDFVFG